MATWQNDLKLACRFCLRNPGFTLISTLLLGLRPIQGRGFLPEEELGGLEPVVIISERLHQRLFGEDPELLGTSITLNGIPRTIIGIVPDLQFVQGVEAWTPIDRNRWNARSTRALTVFGRLNPDHSLESAQTN